MWSRSGLPPAGTVRHRARRSGMLSYPPSRLGGWVRGPASAGPLLYHQVAGLVMVPWASLSFAGNWLLARTPWRICLVKLGRVRCSARLIT